MEKIKLTFKTEQGSATFEPTFKTPSMEAQDELTPLRGDYLKDLEALDEEFAAKKDELIANKNKYAAELEKTGKAFGILDEVKFRNDATHIDIEKSRKYLAMKNKFHIEFFKKICDLVKGKGEAHINTDWNGDFWRQQNIAEIEEAVKSFRDKIGI